MLDPFSALSAASAVVQLVDFGSKLVAGTIEIYQSTQGLNEDHIILEKVSSDMRDISDNLERNLQVPSSGRLSRDEAALLRLAKDCIPLAKQLLDILSDLRVKSDSIRIVESFRQSFRSALKKGKIHDLEARLDKLRNEVNTRMLAILSDQSSNLCSALSLLHAENTRMGANTMHKLDGLRSDLQSVVAENRVSRSWTQDMLENLSNVVFEFSEEVRKVDKEQKILDGLRFKFMQFRHDEIEEAHAKTFSWVFDGSETQFNDWLSSGHGIFWISGKAGSGKSTLTKYLAEHQKVSDSLKLWAGPERLLVATHYFWSAASILQRSLEGLLQTLLYQILKQCPQMIPDVCQERWNGALYDLTEPWNRTDLLQAFDHLSAYQSMAYKFVFFIDGLDEYDGDHYEIVQKFTRLTESFKFKICISSRPWNVFTQTLGKSNNRIQLENLTKGDITIYVKSKLEDDERFGELLAKDPRCEKLLQDIVERAKGVFLWVHLVVKKLLDGLIEGDGVPELQKRLDSLPTRLKSYFKEMLKNIDEIYREHTAQVFQITVQAIQPQSVLIFDYLQQERENPDYAIENPITPILESEVAEVHSRILKRLNAWCRDFLEISIDKSESTFLKYKVDFLHRTVRDFLKTKEMDDFLQENTPVHFNVRVSLCNAILALIKAMPIERESDFEDNLNPLFGLVDEFMFYIQASEQESGQSRRMLLDELDRILTVHSSRGGNPRRHWTNERDIPFGPFEEYGKKTFLAATIQSRLHHYVSEVLNADQAQLKSKEGRPLLDYALRPAIVTPIRIPYQENPIDPDMVQLLLDRGADPNENVHIYGYTVWALFLISRCESRTRTEDMSQPAIFEIARKLIVNDADPKLTCIYSRNRSSTITTSRYKRKIELDKVQLTVREALGQIFPRAKVLELERLLAEQEMKSKQGFSFWRLLRQT